MFAKWNKIGDIYETCYPERIFLCNRKLCILLILCFVLDTLYADFVAKLPKVKVFKFETLKVYGCSQHAAICLDQHYRKNNKEK